MSEWDDLAEAAKSSSKRPRPKKQSPASAVPWVLGIIIGAAVLGGWFYQHVDSQSELLRQYEQRAQKLSNSRSIGVYFSPADAAELEELQRRIGQMKADGVKD